MKGGLVVGIDAGATKTRAFAIDRAGEVVGRGAGGGANLLSSPDPQGSIAAALAEALGGRSAEAIVLSAAGGDRKADRERGRELLGRDAAANSSLQRGAVAPGRAAATVALFLALPGGPVYLSGGAFDSRPLLQRLVRLELLGVLPQASVEPVREEPAMGAARIAMELAWSAAR